MKDVAYFMMNLSTLAFFVLDTVDMVFDFFEVDKLANLCKFGYALPLV